MGLTVNAYNFSKRVNSTAIPTGDGTSFTVNLKNATSKYSPTFELSGAMPDFSFMKWGGRYYFVDDIVKVSNGMYDAICSIDPLATWRTAILNSTQFVNRSASAYDLTMKDPEMSGRQLIVNTELANTVSGLSDGVGCYILRTISGDSNNVSGIISYVLDENELKVALNWLFTDGSVLDSTWDSVVKTVFNPFQYVVSLQYTPIAKSRLPLGTKHQAAFGWWASTANSLKFDTLDGTGGRYIISSLSKPARYFNDFRDYDPAFTEYRMTLPGGATVNIPSIWLSDSLTMEIDFDVIDGTGIVYVGSGSAMASFEIPVSVPIQIGQSAANLTGVAGSSAAAAGSFAIGNPVAGATSAVGAIASLLQPNPSINGKNGNIQALKTITNVHITAIRYGSGLNYPLARYGRILNDVRTLSTLSGFCKCSMASLDIDAPENIQQSILNYMNNGFYIE